MAEDTKDTAGGKGEALEKLSKRVTGLERELRLTKKYMRVVEARIGMTRPELETVRKAGKASVAMLILAGAIALVGSIAYAGTVTLPAGYVAAFGHPPVAYISSSGDLVLGGGAYGTGVTNLVAGATLPAANGAALTNLAGGNIASGNIAVARITNAAGSVGPSIGGNIPIAAITNAAGSVGPSIGGNIPVAAITNAAGSLGASINGAAITGLAAANITAGGAISAINGAAITNISAANVSGNGVGITNIAATATAGIKGLVTAATATGLMVQYGVGSNTTVVTFSPVFATTPTVFLQNATGSAATIIPYPSTVTGTNVTLNGDAAVGNTISWFAIGLK